MRQYLFQERGEKGFTTIELMLTVTILLILMAIIGASYETFKAKIRYAQVKSAMDAIAQSAYNDYTTHDNTWAVNPLPLGTPPTFVNPGDLLSWPVPPCPGWSYTWDNWLNTPTVQSARVTVRREDDSAIYSYCVQTYNSSCFFPDIGGGTPLDLTTLPDGQHYIYCNE